MRRIFILLMLLLGVFARESHGQMAIGMNLAAPSDWSRAWAFKDQMKQARWFGDNLGYLVQWGNDKYPAGRWVCEWEGDDAPHFPRGVASVDEVLPGLAILDVTTPNKGLAVLPFGDVRDIKLWMPGVNRGGSVFHPEYVESLRPFAVLRFMDWQATNNSLVSDWSQRRFIDAPQQWTPKDSQGVAIEHCLDLANEVGVDPWICIPHLATDDFVARLAELIRDRLLPGRICYLEYTNEFWNTAGGFSAGQWLAAQFKITGVSPAVLYGGRVKRIAAIVRPILGGRAKIVICGQAANAWQAKTAAAAAGKGAFDAISCACYFGLPKGYIGTAATTADEVLGLCQADIEGRLVKVLAEHKAIADQHGVEFVCYEGGQHLTASGKDVPHAAALLAVQRDPRMGDLYRLAFAKCRAAGATLVMHFNDVGPGDKWGSWGAREYMLDVAAPKWQSLLEEAQ